MVTLNITYDRYKLLIPSLFDFLKFSVTFLLLNPNIIIKNQNYNFPQ